MQPFEQEFSRHLEVDRARKLRRFPTAVANAFAPPAVALVPVKAVGRYPVGFTLEQTPNIVGLGDPFGGALFVLVMIGACGALATPATRPIAVASLGILGFNWALSAWGSETHLYSQNWHLAAVLLCAGLLRMGRSAVAMTAALGVLTLGVAAINLVILRQMLLLLAAAP